MLCEKSGLKKKKKKPVTKTKAGSAVLPNQLINGITQSDTHTEIQHETEIRNFKIKTDTALYLFNIGTNQ